MTSERRIPVRLDTVAGRQAPTGRHADFEPDRLLAS